MELYEIIFISIIIGGIIGAIDTTIMEKIENWKNQKRLSPDYITGIFVYLYIFGRYIIVTFLFLFMISLLLNGRDCDN